MTLLVVGLVLFLGVHLVPAVPALRARWAARAGENRYRAAFSAVAGVGFVLIIVGYYLAPRGETLFAPWPAARAIAPMAMIVSLVLLAAANMNTHLRATLKHPMLLGVIIWAAVHLAANGDARSTLLFGSFLAYAVVDLASAVARGAVKRITPSLKYDVMAVGGGTALALAVMLVHRYLFGAPAVAWSL